MRGPTPYELKLKWAMRELARDERRKEAAREAHRARKLNALMPWVGQTADERAQSSRHYPSNLGD
jgi:hypothetical protein